MIVYMVVGGIYFVVVVICLFVFILVVVNYVYVESNLYLFKLDNKFGWGIYISLYLLMMIWGVLVIIK